MAMTEKPKIESLYGVPEPTRRAFRSYLGNHCMEVAGRIVERRAGIVPLAAAYLVVAIQKNSDGGIIWGMGSAVDAAHIPQSDLTDILRSVFGSAPPAKN